jgi:hypothetical protein
MNRARMLGLREAADVLGYSERGPRRIIERSRQKAKSVRLTGPTIRFFQTTPSAPIRFKQEWLDEFIAVHTVDPTTRPADKPRTAAKVPRAEPKPITFSGNLSDLRSRHWSC